MQTTTLKSAEVNANPRVVRIWRSPTRNRSQGGCVVPSAAVPKPPGKWTVVAAFVLAMVLHAGAVVWVEMKPETPPLEASAQVLIHSTGQLFEMDTETATAGAAAGRTAAD